MLRWHQCFARHVAHCPIVGVGSTLAGLASAAPAFLLAVSLPAALGFASCALSGLLAGLAAFGAALLACSNEDLSVEICHAWHVPGDMAAAE